MNILIVGEGGREHALAWKAAQSSLVDSIFVAPGNAGTAREAKTHNINISADDIDGLIGFSRENQIELCIVGPEGPLVKGISDAFSFAGIHCFGPTKAAAQLEGSKSFAKDFLNRHNIPTASHASFSNFQDAVEYVKANAIPIVIKADGLAAGKGVIVAHSQAEAIDALEDILDNAVFGEAGASVVIEEFLEGEEASFMCMVADDRILPFASSQDHKAAYDGDKGPNTGGMGAYSPAPVVDLAMHETIMATIIRPTVEGLRDDGLPYTGFLYAGLMIDTKGIPKVIEYNCRMGDPETQPVMMRLDSDLVELCMSAVEGKLPREAKWKSDVALAVVLAARGYPGEYEKGWSIQIDASLSTRDNIKVFHAGTKTGSHGNEILSSGGRVMSVCSLGATTRIAQVEAYKAARLVNWQGMWYRNDIAYRAIDREQN